MDLFDQTRGRSSFRQGIQLQGTRPSPLKVNKDSHKLKKPSLPLPAAPPSTAPRRPPVIIYTVSPKIIHTKPSEFMSLVQRLTGCTSSGAPAKEVAGETGFSVEQSSPGAANRADKEHHGTDELQRLVLSNASLMPSSAGLQLISPNFFSPSGLDINQLNFVHELNVPAMQGNKGMMEGAFLATPGKFFFSL